MNHHTDKVRSVLLGRSGPYADLRTAVDSLDHLAQWISTIDREQQAELASSLYQLIQDPDVTVATGAVLGLDHLMGIDHYQALVDLVLSWGESLSRKPSGFQGVQFSSIGAECAIRAAATKTKIDWELWNQILSFATLHQEWPNVLQALAFHNPDFVLAHGRRYLGPYATGPLLRLPLHWQRIALAMQWRPWPKESIAKVQQAANWMSWNSSDTLALVNVMLDQDPQLTLPADIRDERKWWIVAGEHYNWFLWEACDGEYAIEVLLPGYGFLARSKMLDQAERNQYLSQGLPAVSQLAKSFRNT